MENLHKNLARLEALLFIHGEPLTVKKLGELLELDHDAVVELCLEFEQVLKTENRGLALVKDGEKIQLTTKPELGNIVETFVKSELSEEITPAALETLAIIAYFGPIGRSRIEYQRGVNSIFILRSLLLRGLIERFPDPGRPNAFLYRASFELLKHLGIGNQEELPEYEKFRALLKKFESAAAAEPAAAESAPPAPAIPE